MRIRESGETPGQSRCCESELSLWRLATGFVESWEGVTKETDESEDLPRCVHINATARTDSMNKFDKKQLNYPNEKVFLFGIGLVYGLCRNIL